MRAADNKPSFLYWAFSVILLLWGVAGGMIYLAYFIQSPEEFAASAETAAQREAYADYVANIPAWAIGTGIIAAAARLAGAAGLLLRRSWALPLYVVSLVFFLITGFRAFVLANAAEAMSTGHVLTEIVFVLLTLFAIGLAHNAKASGHLRTVGAGPAPSSV